jgi:hypothetical protein
MTTLLEKLKSLVSEFDARETPPKPVEYKLACHDAPCPPEWYNLPADAAEGKRFILAQLAAEKGWPDYVTDTRGAIWFNCGAVRPMKSNPNGYCHTSGNIGWLEIIETLIAARLKDHHCVHCSNR